MDEKGTGGYNRKFSPRFSNKRVPTGILGMTTDKKKKYQWQWQRQRQC